MWQHTNLYNIDVSVGPCMYTLATDIVEYRAAAAATTAASGTREFLLEILENSASAGGRENYTHIIIVIIIMLEEHSSIWKSVYLPFLSCFVCVCV